MPEPSFGGDALQRGVVVHGDDGNCYVPGEFFDADGNRVEGLRRITDEEAGGPSEEPAA